MASVYLETSFISACVTSRTDPASVYRREESRKWWDSERRRHNLFVSAEVLNELSDRRFPSSADALNWIDGIPLLSLNQEVLGFAAVLIRERVMPAPVQGDAVHVASACVHNMQFMLSWNVRHLANRNKVSHLHSACMRAGLVPPQIITPDLLWEYSDDSETNT
jgi:hypothetical protein